MGVGILFVFWGFLCTCESWFELFFIGLVGGSVSVFIKIRVVGGVVFRKCVLCFCFVFWGFRDEVFGFCF